MSFNEVLQELPTLSFEQRQLIVRRALELDDPPLHAADEALVEGRLAALRDNPTSAFSLEEINHIVKVAAVLHAARHEQHWRKRLDS